MTMENFDNNIDNLFSKKFESFKVEDSEKDWDNYGSKLTRNNFLKFSFISFNVYYLSAMFMLGSIATYSTLNNIHLNKHLKQLQHILQQNQKYETSNNLSLKKAGRNNFTTTQKYFLQESNKNSNQQNLKPEMPKGKNDIGGESFTGFNLSKNNTLPTEESKNVQVISKNKSDSSHNINVTVLQDDTTLKPNVKKVKKIITVKPNSVIVKDTVRITKLH